MGPFRAICHFFGKALVLRERATLSEFWWITPAYFVVILAMGLTETPSFLFQGLMGTLSVLQMIFLFLIVLMVPVFSSFWRRLNDTTIPSWVLLSLPGYIVVAPTIAFLVDRSEAYGIWAPTRLMPEAEYVVFGYFTLILLFFLLCAKSSQLGPNKYGPNSHEVLS